MFRARKPPTEVTPLVSGPFDGSDCVICLGASEEVEPSAPLRGRLHKLRCVVACEENAESCPGQDQLLASVGVQGGDIVLELSLPPL